VVLIPHFQCGALKGNGVKSKDSDKVSYQNLSREKYKLNLFATDIRATDLRLRNEERHGHLESKTPKIKIRIIE
jgi:hypothetical protein